MALTVDTAGIAQAGRSVAGLAPNLTSQSDGLHSIEVKAGNFAEANALKGKLDGCVQAYVAALTRLRDDLEKAGDDVKVAANGYVATEEQAIRDAGSPR